MASLSVDWGQLSAVQSRGRHFPRQQVPSSWHGSPGLQCVYVNPCMHVCAFARMHVYIVFICVCLHACVYVGGFLNLREIPVDLIARHLPCLSMHRTCIGAMLCMPCCMGMGGCGGWYPPLGALAIIMALLC